MSCRQNHLRGLDKRGRCLECRVLASNTYQRTNKAKLHVYRATWRDKNRADYKLRMRKNVLAAYGLTLETYDALYQLQGGRCGICTTSQKELRKTLHVDHDHVTGRVRGLLCSSCNRAIGWLKDDPAVLDRAAKYLRDSKTNGTTN